MAIGPTRVVVVDPGHRGTVGHHNQVNQQLLQGLRQRGLMAELWADVQLEAEPEAPQPLLGAFSGCGYEDPRLWQDLGGTLQLARRLETQLKLATAAGEPVQAWLAHSLLPFQLLGLARHLASAPRATVLLSLMFAPSETLAGPGDPDQALANCRVALAALARAAAQAGHRLLLTFPSRQQEQLYAPLLQATGLHSGGIHPAVVGAGCQPQPPSDQEPPLVLLHWGDLKPGKGRQEALQVLQQLLEEGAPEGLKGWGWLFHVHSARAMRTEERTLLEKVGDGGVGLQWLQGAQSSAQMEQLLARCPVAMLAYDPQMYGQRSSGMLWHWGAARQAVGRTAAAVGYAEGWLAREAPLLGIDWGSPSEAGGWLDALGRAASQERRGGEVPEYGRAVLGKGFATWCASCLKRLREQP